MPSPRALHVPGDLLGSLTVKADGTLTTSGYLVRFSDEDSPDLHGDYFTKATDFGPLSDGETVVVPAYFDHGTDATIKTERLGHATLKMDDEGVFAEYVIQKRQSYLKRLIKEKHLGQSSGTLGRFASSVKSTTGKGNFIETWPIGEASLTPTPAEPTTDAKSVSEKAEGESLNAQVERVGRAFSDLYRGRSSYGYATDVYPDHVIANVSGDNEQTSFKVGYADDGTDVTFDDSALWERVERVVTYEPVSKALSDLREELATAAALRGVRDSLR